MHTAGELTSFTADVGVPRFAKHETPLKGAQGFECRWSVRPHVSAAGSDPARWAQHENLRGRKRGFERQLRGGRERRQLACRCGSG